MTKDSYRLKTIKVIVIFTYVIVPHGHKLPRHVHNKTHLILVRSGKIRPESVVIRQGSTSFMQVGSVGVVQCRGV